MWHVGVRAAEVGARAKDVGSRAGNMGAKVRSVGARAGEEGTRLKDVGTVTGVEGARAGCCQSISAERGCWVTRDTDLCPSPVLEHPQGSPPAIPSGPCVPLWCHGALRGLCPPHPCPRLHPCSISAIPEQGRSANLLCLLAKPWLWL